MWPGFDSRTRRHMWVEFVVGSRPCSEGFSPGSPVFLPPQKPTLPNSNSIGNSRATGLSVARLLRATLVKQSLYYYYYYYYVFSPIFGEGKRFAFLYLKYAEVITFDYTGYRNLHRRGAIVVSANAINPANAFVAGFLLLHNQLLIINSNQLKSIKFRRLSE